MRVSRSVLIERGGTIPLSYSNWRFSKALITDDLRLKHMMPLMSYQSITNGTHYHQFLRTCKTDHSLQEFLSFVLLKETCDE